jgi:hypothetical protein
MAYYVVTCEEVEARDKALEEFARFTLKVANSGRKVELEVEAFKNNGPEATSKVSVFIVEAPSTKEDAARLFLKSVKVIFEKKGKPVPKIAFHPFKCLNVVTGKFSARVNSPKFWPGKKFVNSANYIFMEKTCISCNNEKH